MSVWKCKVCYKHFNFSKYTGPISMKINNAKPFSLIWSKIKLQFGSNYHKYSINLDRLIKKTRFQYRRPAKYASNGKQGYVTNESFINTPCFPQVSMRKTFTKSRTQVVFTDTECYRALNPLPTVTPSFNDS